MGEIHDLFDAAANEIQGAGGDAAFEFTAEHFISPREDEEVTLLFNLALISLHHSLPEAEAILTSDLRQISSDELRDVLEATEKALDVPAISLNALRAENAKKISNILSGEESSAEILFKGRSRKTVRAPASRRLLGAVIDIAVAASLAAILCAILISVRFPALENELFHSSARDFYRLLPALSMYLTLFMVCLILYPFFAYRIVGATAGTALARVKLISLGRARLSTAQIAARACLAPLSLLSLSFLKILDGEEPLHDRLSGTDVIA